MILSYWKSFREYVGNNGSDHLTLSDDFDYFVANREILRERARYAHANKSKTIGDWFARKKSEEGGGGPKNDEIESPSFESLHPGLPEPHYCIEKRKREKAMAAIAEKGRATEKGAEERQKGSFHQHLDSDLVCSSKLRKPDRADETENTESAW